MLRNPRVPDLAARNAAPKGAPEGFERRRQDAVEIEIDRALGDPGACRDTVEGRARIAFLRKLREGRVEELARPLGLAPHAALRRPSHVASAHLREAALFGY